MSYQPDPEPDERGTAIFVGQDRAGHWLVQDSHGMLEGRFVSRGAAMQFAAAECRVYRAVLRCAAEPLVPRVSFEPLGAER
ncbi:hypothetical protein QLH51_14605 [Sphingomonas sp. 2R-10]|uniref:hypothetical protein n=1 Tax=Sphingomonas sp. 2R-10 TaxID=3045148 RepID=UPI000F7B12A8|nr:hypothetical protein [Sphingomonas sp. 2R-10]MDJ0278027.1 hypothetical protein [Sphingomonas sp. 2R-10]